MTQREVSVAIQGEVGSNHDLAASYYFGPRYEAGYCTTFDQVFAAVENGETDFGLAAAENTIVGPIVPTWDLLRRRAGVLVVGEAFLRINHALITLPGTSLHDIRTVLSHPAALGQCAEFLARELPDARLQPTHDTAASADMILQQGDRTVAAIAGPNNAERLGLEVLLGGIADDSENYTRFLALQRADQVPSDQPVGANKTSLLIERLNNAPDDNQPGALHGALGGFALHGVNLSMIQSRPTRDRVWRYGFYLDCEAGISEEGMQASLRDLRRVGAEWRSLGTYMAGQTYGD